MRMIGGFRILEGFLMYERQPIALTQEQTRSATLVQYSLLPATTTATPPPCPIFLGMPCEKVYYITAAFSGVYLLCRLDPRLY